MKKKKWMIVMVAVFSALIAGCVNQSNSSKTDTISNSSKQSKSEVLSYRTTYNSKKITKQAIVYLPKNYKKNYKHNILYLLHGSTEVNNGQSLLYKEGNFKQTFDKLSDQGKLKNTIVIFPTYYPTEKQVSSNYYSDDPLNRRFAKNELVQDLIPAVEKKYKTYATNTSKSALRKSRAHRAFGGFSMGSITTWYVFQYDLPYFKYFVPMAGDSWTVTSDGGASEPAKTAQVLAREAKKYPKLSFKILAGVGAGDGTRSSMIPQINAMRKLAIFKNKIQYYEQANGNHDAPTMAKIIQHYGSKLFR